MELLARRSQAAVSKVRSALRQARAPVLLYAAVAAGSVLGSLARWFVSGMLPGPFGTLAENASGSLLIGFVARLAAPDGRLFLGPRARHFFLTGICGGYTTFSMFSHEVGQLLMHEPFASLVYVLASLSSWMAAVWLGDALATRLNRLRGASP